MREWDSTTWVLSGSGRRGEVQHSLLLCQCWHKWCSWCSWDWRGPECIAAAAMEVPLSHCSCVQWRTVGEQHRTHTASTIVTAPNASFSFSPDAVACPGILIFAYLWLPACSFTPTYCCSCALSFDQWLRCFQECSGEAGQSYLRIVETPH